MLHRLACMLCFLLLACGRSSPTTYYAFPLNDAPTSSDQLPKKTLRIARIAIPNYLDREPIVVRAPDNVTFTVNPLNVWAEPLGDGIRRLVHNVFFPKLVTQGITVLPVATEATGTYTLLLDILALDATQTTAALRAQWALQENANNTTLKNGIYTQELPLKDPSYATIVATEGRLVEDCATHIVDEILPRLARK